MQRLNAKRGASGATLDEAAGRPRTRAVKLEKSCDGTLETGNVEPVAGGGYALTRAAEDAAARALMPAAAVNLSPDRWGAAPSSAPRPTGRTR